MENYSVMIETGFDDIQHHTIAMEEAHKAYYLFLNPEKRGIFSNGLALIGKDIRKIRPDYHDIMGWNRTHKLDTYDYQELKQKGVDRECKLLLAQAKEVGAMIQSKPELAALPLSQVVEKLKLKAPEPKKQQVCKK